MLGCDTHFSPPLLSTKCHRSLLFFKFWFYPEEIIALFPFWSSYNHLFFLSDLPLLREKFSNIEINVIMDPLSSLCHMKCDRKCSLGRLH